MGAATLSLFEAPEQVAHLCHPSGPPSRDELQAEMVRATVERYEAGAKSLVLEAPTGFGKSKLAADLVRHCRNEWGWKALFVADEQTLVNQASESLRPWGVETAVEMADRKAGTTLLHTPDVVVGSRQTLGRKGSGPQRYEAMLNRLRWNRCELLIIDEAHCGITGEELQRVVDAVNPRLLLGLTATPYLADGTRLVPKFFEDYAYRYSLEDLPDGTPGAISNGHLVPVYDLECETTVDLKGLKTSMTKDGRDFDQRQLSELLSGKLGELANATRQVLDRHGPWNRAICFNSSVDLAKAAADIWTRLGYPSAAVYGEHPDKSGVFRRYQEGDYRVLCVCQMGIKGFDDPPTDVGIDWQPTQSYPRARQKLGRVLRLSSATDKTRALWIAAAWQSAREKRVVTLLDILAEGLPEAEREAVRRAGRRRKPGAKDASAEVKDAVAAYHRQVKVAAQRRDVKHRTRHRNVLALTNLPAELERLPTYSVSSPERVTKQQKARAREVGIGDRRMSGHTASSFESYLRQWEGRKDAGMATYKQMLAIRRANPSITEDRVLGMTLREAGQLIDQLRGNG